ncbi:type I polyketide synthase [Dictyobacter vulcani]|uniref:type I polyketide synthase n=1 Tax=Dictyobacter vulcani TaxID=2607529 RepID=UPI001E4BF3A9
MGYTAPSIQGQAEVINTALKNAGLSAEEISYVEAHGTATPLGDPIEITALTQVYSTYTDKKNYCAIGSVKSNLGHLDAAAGVAGLIKTVQALKHRELPPTLHFVAANAKIDFAQSPFHVNTQLTPWETQSGLRRAGVSSFGIGGTNAHVIVEEAPVVTAAVTETVEPSLQALILSARTASALETATENMSTYLQQHAELSLADVAYTLQVGRRAFKNRRVIICQDLPDALEVLRTRDAARIFNMEAGVSNRPVAFMFPGQGTQYINMAAELYQHEPVFRAQLDECAEILKPLLDLDLRSILYPQEQQEQEATTQLAQTRFTQPALFVIEYALAQLWIARGVQPTAMIGHSIGEYVAACLAGVFSLQDALALVATRGRLMQLLPAGAMLAVSLAELELRPLLGASLSLAAINAPEQCVVSGTKADIEQLIEQLNARGIDNRRLHTSHAFHSQMMDPILGVFGSEVARIQLHAPQIRYISNLSGTWISAAQATDPGYWVQHLRQAVRFADGIQALLQEADLGFLEVGPGQTLSRLLKQQAVTPPARPVIATLRAANESQSDRQMLLQASSRLWLSGVSIDWSATHHTNQFSRIPLPTYPFERQRFWIEAGANSLLHFNPIQRPVESRKGLDDWYYVLLWKQTVLPTVPAATVLSGQKSNWLLFVDTFGVGTGLVARLKQVEQEVVSVTFGTDFTQISAYEYVINPQRSEDFDALLTALWTHNLLPDQIIHTGLITVDEQTLPLEKRLESSLDTGLYSLLFLAQALERQNTTKPLRLYVVTNNVCSVSGTEELAPEKVTVLGPCKVMPLEYAFITCQHIDLVLTETWKHQRKNALELLFNEIVQPIQEKNTSIAYRGARRWIQSFEAADLKAYRESSPLRPDGVYLITGGMGGIGLSLAEYLAQEVQARLILVGRSTFPARQEWAGWLSEHEEHDATSQKIHTLQSIEAAGGQVQIYQADITDQQQMQAVIEQATAHFGTINGVLHAAGVPAGGLMQLKTREAVEEILAPKVKGALVLNELFKAGDLDFLALFSSLTAILGSLGQVDYCAANAFMDALAYHNNKYTAIKTIALNWDVWQEVGMAVNSAKAAIVDERAEERLSQGIRPTEGYQALRQALCTGFEQILISTREIAAQFERVQAYTADNLLTQESASTGLSLHLRPDLVTSYVAPQTESEQKLAAIWQNLLGIDAIGIHDNFFDLGGHSLLATKVMSRVRETFNVELTVRALFGASTIAELAQTIVQSQSEALEPAVSAIRKVERVQENEYDHMLTDMDQLSDAEIEAMLNMVLTEDDASE